MEDKDTGLLLSKKNIELHRSWFKQFTKLHGINVLFRAPRANFKEYNTHAELNAYYYEPVIVGCIYDEHPKIQTMKKLGWVTETNDVATLIHVPYDLEGVQAGALFIIPSGLDNSEGRVFRVSRMSTIAVYPASITCELVPVWLNEMPLNETKDFTESNFNVLSEEDEDINLQPISNPGYQLLNTEEEE